MRFSVKSEKPEARVLPYPRLMQLRNNKDCVVLFVGKLQGHMLTADGFGPLDTEWIDEEHWQPFIGTITVRA